MSRLLSLLGALITLVYLGFAYWLIGDRLFQLKTLELNAVGDFFAGIFGPLAILWLVLGFFQQGMELRQNNEALQLQAQELNNSVKQQAELVEVTRKQLDLDLEVLKDERQARRKALCPYLIVTTKFDGSFAGGDRYIVNFKNAGYVAEEFSLSFDGFVINQVFSDAHPLESGCSTTTIFTVVDKDAPLAIVVSYVDGERFKHFITYSAEYYRVESEEKTRLRFVKGASNTYAVL